MKTRDVCFSGDYLSPSAVVYGMQSEGLLCSSLKHIYEDTITDPYESRDDLIGIF